jgi:hypothetical protein
MRDRLATVLRVRGLQERRRQAEEAAARRRAREAERERREAERARDEAATVPGTVARAQLLVLHRLGGLAHAERAEEAGQRQAAAEGELSDAQRRTVEAAVARRSVERLQERRTEEVVRRVERSEQRRTDEAAMQVWRRGS